MEGILYIIKNDINDKVYIGKTYGSLKQRWKLHISDSKKENRNNRPLYNAMNKYGVEHFYIEEIARYPQNILEEKEVEYIKKFNSYNNGYNATKGGDGKRYKKLINEIFTEEEMNKIIQLYYIYPNASFISKQLGIHIRTFREILDYNKLSTLSMKILSEVDNRKYIYQILNGQIINIFNSYEEVMKYVNENQLGKYSTSDSLRATLSIKKQVAFGYKWEIKPLKEVFQYYVSNMIKEYNLAKNKINKERK